MIGRPLHRTLIVDNLPVNYRLQPDNGIHIRSWYDNDDDEALGKLYALLLSKVSAYSGLSESHKNDVRAGLREMSAFIRD